MKNFRTFFYFFVAFSMLTILFAGDVTGCISMVEIDRSSAWKAASIQLVDGNDNPISFGESCVTGGSSSAMWKINDDLDKALLSLALAAKASKQQVRVWTSGCLTPPEVIANQEKLSAIDYGLRK